MPSLTPVDESYFDRAPQRFAHTWLIARPAGAVWAELVGERPLHWCRGLSIGWTSPPPFGVGSTRRAKVLGGLMVGDEHFFIWEEGRRHAFYFTHANLPAFTSVAEDYLVEGVSTERCRFTWRVGLTPSALGKPGTPSTSCCSAASSGTLAATSARPDPTSTRLTISADRQGAPRGSRLPSHE